MGWNGSGLGNNRRHGFQFDHFRAVSLAFRPRGKESNQLPGIELIELFNDLGSFRLEPNKTGFF